MPSKKKKGRGKAKKAAKKAEEQLGTLDTQMERLKIDEDSTNADEDALLEEAIKLAAAEKEEMDAADAKKEEQLEVCCMHGYRVETMAEHELISAFVKTFLSTFLSFSGDASNSSFAVSLEAATKSAKEECPSVWSDSSKLKLVVSFLLRNGTQHILKGDFVAARYYAPLAPYFEHISLADVNRAASSTTTMLELFKCDEHTLVKYLRKHIPCACLDEKYKEVKSMTRTGLCRNPECLSAVERSKMLSCARCGNSNYCSRKCQKAHWPDHKECCGKQFI